MTTLINENMKVGEIVARNYDTAGILKKHGLDFCCGGGKSLKEACGKKNLDPDNIIRELAEILDRPAGEGSDFNRWSPEHLIDYIEERHHSYVRTKIDEIRIFAEKVAMVHGSSHPENIEIFQLFSQLAEEMAGHLESEEKTVFPLIKSIYEKRLTGSEVKPEEMSKLKGILAEMEDEHELAGNLMKNIRELSNDFTPPEDACMTYRVLYHNLQAFEEDLHRHVHLENNILFEKMTKLVA